MQRILPANPTQMKNLKKMNKKTPKNGQKNSLMQKKSRRKSEFRKKNGQKSRKTHQKSLKLKKKRIRALQKLTFQNRNTSCTRFRKRKKKNTKRIMITNSWSGILVRSQESKSINYRCILISSAAFCVQFWTLELDKDLGVAPSEPLLLFCHNFSSKHLIISRIFFSWF